MLGEQDAEVVQYLRVDAARLIERFGYPLGGVEVGDTGWQHRLKRAARKQLAEIPPGQLHLHRPPAWCQQLQSHDIAITKVKPAGGKSFPSARHRRRFTIGRRVGDQRAQQAE